MDSKFEANQRMDQHPLSISFVSNLILATRCSSSYGTLLAEDAHLNRVE